MIRIRNNRIWLYTNRADSYNADTEEKLPTLNFQLISAYICPKCENILSAYFVGNVTKELVQKYTKGSGRDFQVGSTNGGSYIKDTTHGIYNIYYTSRARCKWKAAPGRGIQNCLAALCSCEPSSIPQSFVKKLENNELTDQGLHRLDDVCGTDRPIVLYDINTICSRLLDFEKETYVGEELAKLIEAVSAVEEAEQTEPEEIKHTWIDTNSYRHSTKKKSKSDNRKKRKTLIGQQTRLFGCSL